MYNTLLAIKQLLDTEKDDTSSPLNKIKNVYIGDPILIPASSLPAITIEDISMTLESTGNIRPKRNIDIEIRLIYSIMDFIKSSPNQSKLYSQEFYFNVFDSMDKNLVPVKGTIMQLLLDNAVLSCDTGSQIVKAGIIKNITGYKKMTTIRADANRAEYPVKEIRGLITVSI